MIRGIKTNIPFTSALLKLKLSRMSFLNLKINVLNQIVINNIIFYFLVMILLCGQSVEGAIYVESF